MSEKLCAECGGIISPTRIAAIKDCELCKDCVEKSGDVERVMGYMTWEHKTAPTLVIDTPKAVNEFLGMTRRGPRPQLPFSPKKGISPSIDLSSNVLAKSADTADTASKLEGVEGTHAGAQNMLSSKCHPDRPRVSPSGKCAECALEWYRIRGLLYRAKT